MKKYCVKCGNEFDAVGREVICPACKAQAAEESKRAAVLRAKRASWAGESVPVRISGRASTLIRAYGKHNNLPFAAALDELLKATSFVGTLGIKWEEIKPYKSHRRDKATSTTESTTETAQDTPQGVARPPQEVKQTAKQAEKASVSKTTSKASASKPQEVKQANGQANGQARKLQEVKQASKASASKASASKAASKGDKA